MAIRSRDSFSLEFPIHIDVLNLAARTPSQSAARRQTLSSKSPPSKNARNGAKYQNLRIDDDQPAYMRRNGETTA
jgi:hypothetical protein